VFQPLFHARSRTVRFFSSNSNSALDAVFRLEQFNKKPNECNVPQQLTEKVKGPCISTGTVHVSMTEDWKKNAK
jgi:hypothetical protein